MPKLVPAEIDPSSAGEAYRARGDVIPRSPVRSLEVRLGGSGAAKVLNISSGGAALQTTKYLRVGNRCPLVFRGSVGELALQATVAWSRLVGTVAVAEKEVESVYVAGLSFADVPKVKRRLLERLIAAEAGSKTGKAAAGSESGDPQESARSAGPPGQGSASSSVLPFLDERDRQTRDATSRCGFVRETRNTFDRLFENGDSRFVGTADDQNEDA